MATIVGTLGNDSLLGINHERNDIWGDVVGEGTGIFGDDHITGGDGATVNTLYGDASSLVDGQAGAAVGGDDTLIGGKNSINTLWGDASSSESAAVGGDDTLVGGVGGMNNLIGDFGEIVMGTPRGGMDRLVSADRTTDHMVGDFLSASNSGGGADTFVFGPHNGEDFIHDFTGSQTATLNQPDIIEISGFKKLDSFSDLNIQLVDTNKDGIDDSSKIAFGENDFVIVLGYNQQDAAHTLAEADFMFT